jgi:hypothetical protein
MELILKSNNKESLEKITALAKKLNVVVEKRKADLSNTAKDNLKNRILNFKAKESSSFGDAAEWEQQQRSDRKLPFS